MAKVSEEISKSNATSQGRTDANLANDSVNLGGIAAEDYATKKYVQEYHNTKETAQKSYIDQQDQTILNEAKEYANSQIRNQDFSGFAKVTDVQALDKKLSDNIENGLTTQKNYTDQKTQAIVDDVNANFQDVNGAISTLNGNMNNLFQSVSNGKSQVAEAITDKGISTSANDSFSTMASNIRSIPTSGGGGSGTDPNYVNTSDATATASDILLGKTAYAKGEKVYGTLIAQAEPGTPTYGTDTSNATATADDIKYGKTAYARGQLLIGTAMAEVEEIYGTVDNEPYKLNNTNLAIIAPPDGAEKIEGGTRKLLTFTKNGNYCVSDVVGNDTKTKYIESFMVTDKGLAYQASTNQSGVTTYKKYRYTYDELGLKDDEGNIGTIQSMAFSEAGFDSDSNKCILGILYYIAKPGGNDKEYYVRLLTYHMSDNGAIGKAYDTEYDAIDSRTLVYKTNSIPVDNNLLIFSNNDIFKFYVINQIVSYNSSNVIPYIGNIYLQASLSGENRYFINITSGDRYKINNAYIIKELRCSMQDDILYVYTGNTYTTLRHVLLFDIENGSVPKSCKEITDCIAGEVLYNGARYVIAFTSTMYTQCKLYRIARDTDSLELILEKSLTCKRPAGYESNYPIACGIISTDGKNLIYIAGSVSASTLQKSAIIVQDISDIFTIEDSAEIEYKQVEYLNTNITLYSDIIYSINKNSTKIYIGCPVSIESGKGFFIDLTTLLDIENIIGLKYKNQFFMKMQPNLLTAGGGDVKEGKTFIGWMGYPETGTGQF